MALVLAEKLRKVSFKVLPVYLMGAFLLYQADPRPQGLLLGFPLVILGESLRVWATGHLQKNQKVTTSGPYAYVKNPLYLGTFLLMVGFCLMADQLMLLLIGVGVFLFYYAPYKKRRESGRLEERFGRDWLGYDARVPDYWPRWTPYEDRERMRWNWQRFFKNSEHETLLVVALGASWIVLKFLS